MVKVSTTHNSGNEAIAAKSTGSSSLTKASTHASEAFSSILKASSIQAFDGSLKELISTVKSAGEKFIRNPNDELLKSYKDSITLFLDQFRKEFLRLKEEFGTKRNGEQKINILIETVSEEVATVTRETLSESKATELLASLDDIRGLVIDILG